MFVGSAEAARAVSPDADVFDLDGRTVLPGFTDSHTHFKRASAFIALHLDFDTIDPGSVADVTSAVKARASVEPAGTWIQGDGVDPSRLREGRFPDRYELDAVSGDHPVVLRSVGRHVVTANSLALHFAGIDESTADPPGAGSIVTTTGSRPAFCTRRPNSASTRTAPTR